MRSQLRLLVSKLEKHANFIRVDLVDQVYADFERIFFG
jgi:hypothetical protein